MPKRTVAKLINLLTGESERVLQNQIDDRQALSMLDNVDAFMSSRQIFAPPDVIEVAALMEPGDIFTGVAGEEKMCDWVEANINIVEADPACAAVLALWGAENIEAVADADGGEAAIAGHAATNFSPYMSIAGFQAAFEAYVIANIGAVSGDTEISAALVGAGWTAPGP